MGQCWAVKNQNENKLSAAEMRMLHWICVKTRQDMIRNYNIKERVPAGTYIRKDGEN